MAETEQEKQRFEALERRADALVEQCSRVIEATEDYLQVTRGTLADTKRDDHFTAIMKIASTIEPLVNEILRRHIQDNRGNQSKGTEALAAFVVKTTDRDRKQRLARDLDLISEWRSAFISAVYQVRDRYAHNVKNMHLTISEVAEKIANDGGQRDLDHVLAGGKEALGRKNPLVNETSARVKDLSIRFGMYIQFSAFLEEVLNVAKPSNQTEVSLKDTP